ncbi:MBL fold metallo-hydrolase [Herbiconiux sp. CPCC 205763]|uniref:MBL fold metallo-hydrolase n=1 Tax=Herbiconiux aconitum TaxID=2970913 RepID=A0ABT2GRY5_9MICO|nr:MBL fold metallo-hydrolase [Herbiconiux aconitum]MCS5717571.1 MBL fold metallo-hydrolase [Herbiconiux aconitum]
MTDEVTFVEGPASNWIVLTGSDGVDLIDAGYPDDAPLVVESLAAVGAALGDLRRIWVTHAHTDHIGGIPELLRGAPQAVVLTGRADVEPTRGIGREQVTVAKLGARLLRPLWFRWALSAARAGGLRDIAVPTARALTAADVAGSALEPIEVPGHTDGSTAFVLDHGAVVATGDVIVTHHPTLPRRQPPRPQAIDAVFSHDPGLARDASLTLLGSTATVVLPGHGPAMARTLQGWELLEG